MATNIKSRTHYKESEDAGTLYQLQTGPTAHVSSIHTQLERCFKAVPVGCHVSHWIVQDWARLGKCLPPFISTFPRCVYCLMQTSTQWRNGFDMQARGRIAVLSIARKLFCLRKQLPSTTLMSPHTPVNSRLRSSTSFVFISFFYHPSHTVLMCDTYYHISLSVV